MKTVFWDRMDMLMVEFIQQGTTMSEVYRKTLKKLYRVIQNKRHGLLTSGVVLLHANVCLHMSTAARTRALLEYSNWELFDQLPYTPDLALSNYQLFTYLKNWLQSQCLNNNEILMEGVKMWLRSQAADVTYIRKQSAFHMFLVHTEAKAFDPINLL
jgi:hypothetical protein